jgi:hypothetical protein
MDTKKKLYREIKVTLEELKAMLLASGVVIPEGCQCYMHQGGEQNTVTFVAVEDVVE